MRAIRIQAPGDADVLRLEQLPTPEPGPGQARVRVAFSRVNGSSMVCVVMEEPG